MVALPTPAVAATPSTVILPKPSEASSSRVASRIARSARRLRGRPGERRGSGDGSASSVTVRELPGERVYDTERVRFAHRSATLYSKRGRLVSNRGGEAKWPT